MSVTLVVELELGRDRTWTASVGGVEGAVAAAPTAGDAVYEAARLARAALALPAPYDEHTRH